MPLDSPALEGLHGNCQKHPVKEEQGREQWLPLVWDHWILPKYRPCTELGNPGFSEKKLKKYSWCSLCTFRLIPLAKGEKIFVFVKMKISLYLKKYQCSQDVNPQMH